MTTPSRPSSGSRRPSRHRPRRTAQGGRRVRPPGARLACGARGTARPWPGRRSGWGRSWPSATRPRPGSPSSRVAIEELADDPSLRDDPWLAQHHAGNGPLVSPRGAPSARPSTGPTGRSPTPSGSICSRWSPGALATKGAALPGGGPHDRGDRAAPGVAGDGRASTDWSSRRSGHATASRSGCWPTTHGRRSRRRPSGSRSRGGSGSGTSRSGSRAAGPRRPSTSATGTGSWTSSPSSTAPTCR